MCGIAGFMGTAPLQEDRLAHCRSLMDHRGPDADGIYAHIHGSGRCVNLLHSRLSILDLSEKASQPMGSGRHVLCYNGELYNYLELRQELKAQGKCFATTSDTEVMLRLLESTNDPGEALDRCEGMWAFAFYDEAEGTVLLSRDRFGEKPLYIWDTDEGTYFGSEVKFLAALAGRWPEVNRDHCLRLLAHGYKSLYKNRETWFKSIHELPPATTMTLGAKKSSPTPYWRPQIKANDSMGFNEAAECVREAMGRSLKIRLRADVPMAFCLSGGVDSGSLVSLAAQSFGYDVHGFTVVDTDGRYNEREQVRTMVSKLGIRHSEVPVSTDNFLDNLKMLVWAHDGPVATISYYAHWMLMQKVAERGYKISVSGTGADELFTGYYDHHLLYLQSVASNPVLHDLSLQNWKERIWPLIRNPMLQDPDAYIHNPERREHIFDGALENKALLVNSFEEAFTEQEYTSSLLRNRMLNELFHETIPVILREDDLNAMYWSIENRSPFLDRALFDLCGTIPDSHLIRNGYAKAVLREAMRGIVPDTILDQYRKVGFNAAIRSFLDLTDNAVCERILEPSPVFELVCREKFEALLRQERLSNVESKFLFSMLNVKFFLEQFEQRAL